MTSNYERILCKTPLSECLANYIISFLNTPRKVDDKEFFKKENLVNEHYGKIIFPARIRSVTRTSFEEEYMLNKYRLNNHFNLTYVRLADGNYDTFLKNFWLEHCYISKDTYYYPCRWNVNRKNNYPSINVSIKFHTPYDKIILEKGLFKGKSVRFAIDTVCENDVDEEDIFHQLLYNPDFRNIEKQALQAYFREKTRTPNKKVVKKKKKQSFKNNIQDIVEQALWTLNEHGYVYIEIVNKNFIHQFIDPGYSHFQDEDIEDYLLTPISHSRISNPKTIDEYTEDIFRLYTLNKCRSFTIRVDNNSDVDSNLRHRMVRSVTQVLNLLKIGRTGVCLEIDNKKLIISESSEEDNAVKILVDYDDIYSEEEYLKYINKVYKYYVYNNTCEFMFKLSD